MALIILRSLFCMVSLGIAVLILNSPSMREAPDWVPWVVLLAMIGIPLAAILIDSFIRRKDLTVITSVYFGLLIGVFLTYVAVLALSPLLASFSNSPILPWLPLILGMLLCYVSTSVLIQTRNDF
ncbi:MAG: PIN/TRAM domain-containing protein, partial [Planctomycetota bacterium]|nr:PIN/TRAM domain-containing protein [Planctomycetota bacterium]